MTEAPTVQTAEIVQEEDLPHAPAVVWRALTERDLISRWLMKTDFALERGRAFTFRMDVPPDSPWDGIVKSEVFEIEPERRLSIAWISGGIDTRVTWTLTLIEGGTRLTLVQTGFELPAHQHAYQGAVYGWKRFTGQLKTLLDEIA